jgi:nicotinamidase-related amidase
MDRAWDWRAYLQTLPRYAPSGRLDPDRTALLIVDMQRGSAHRDSISGIFLREHYPERYAYYFDRIERLVVPTLARLVTAFRAAGRRTVYLTVAAHSADGADFEHQRREREGEIERAYGRRSVLTHVGSADAQILPEIAPQPTDVVLNKVSRSAFSSSGLDQVLRNMGITGLAVGGVATNACVAATAFDAADRGYRTVLIEDACAAIDRLLHDATLLIFSHLYGRVLGADALLRELEARGEP